ncbi:hypothetical protein GGR50DRAFT_82357 [Xylaria sp. CBS 124048]|nr:hypothetical protein GGR50DRAFT_82357 [Xylaria sp. CBS 124048]
MGSSQSTVSTPISGPLASANARRSQLFQPQQYQSQPPADAGPRPSSEFQGINEFPFPPTPRRYSLQQDIPGSSSGYQELEESPFPYTPQRYSLPPMVPGSSSGYQELEESPFPYTPQRYSLQRDIPGSSSGYHELEEPPFPYTPERYSLPSMMPGSSSGYQELEESPFPYAPERYSLPSVMPGSISYYQEIEKAPFPMSSFGDVVISSLVGPNQVCELHRYHSSNTWCPRCGNINDTSGPVKRNRHRSLERPLHRSPGSISLDGMLSKPVLETPMERRDRKGKGNARQFEIGGGDDDVPASPPTENQDSGLQGEMDSQTKGGDEYAIDDSMDVEEEDFGTPLIRVGRRTNASYSQGESSQGSSARVSSSVRSSRSRKSRRRHTEMERLATIYEEAPSS